MKEKECECPLLTYWHYGTYADLIWEPQKWLCHLLSAQLGLRTISKCYSAAKHHWHVSITVSLITCADYNLPHPIKSWLAYSGPSKSLHCFSHTAHPTGIRSDSRIAKNAPITFILTWLHRSKWQSISPTSQCWWWWERWWWWLFHNNSGSSGGILYGGEDHKQPITDHTRPDRSCWHLDRRRCSIVGSHLKMTH